MRLFCQGTLTVIPGLAGERDKWFPSQRRERMIALAAE